MLQNQQFPINTVFWGDAGFVGYDVWNSILDKEHRFLIRFGTNFTLITKLGYYTRDDVYLLTNVLNAQHLSDGLASQLYKLRWGI